MQRLVERRNGVEDSSALHSSSTFQKLMQRKYLKPSLFLCENRQEARRKGETSSGHKKKLKGDLMVKELAPIQVCNSIIRTVPYQVGIQLESTPHHSYKREAP
ncbi:hypothetical protein IGI04_002845 [Brassica rapa subsp. trilocularis]|uniref:Uncharacterized protein n=1 Tax=Brassica rapa subsp. trilocularis TaxID=1813537 RepID=A0ABQ7NWP0_BRACM|nr:hypothetical protein IGI04_002845 [Brassica rapa subsp. trilocularis]